MRDGLKPAGNTPNPQMTAQALKPRARKRQSTAPMNQLKSCLLVLYSQLLKFVRCTACRWTRIATEISICIRKTTINQLPSKFQ
eukprot:13474504-Heterocapsa_arctica.AAC.1